MWCVADNRNYMCHICATAILDSNFNQAVMEKIKFQRNCPNLISHVHQNRTFLSIIGTFLNQLLLPYEYYGSDM